MVFLTLTLRHRNGQHLDVLWQAVSECWDAATKGRPWQTDKDELGVLGFVRATEVTVGTNGWHPHTHAVLIMRGDVTDHEVDGAMHRLVARWARKAVGLGLESPLGVAQDWQRVTSSTMATVCEYLSKTHREVDPSRIGLEMTTTQSKTARSAFATRSMWEVLASAVTDGDAQDVRRWYEWEEASHGRRQLSWSRGLRERFGLGVEQSDETVASEEVGTVDDTVVYLTANGWLRCVNLPALIPVVLDKCEQLDSAAFSAWLWGEGIEHDRC